MWIKKTGRLKKLLSVLHLLEKDFLVIIFPYNDIVCSYSESSCKALEQDKKGYLFITENSMSRFFNFGYENRLVIGYWVAGFTPFEQGTKEDAKEVGERIYSLLKKYKLPVEWSGKPDNYIFIDLD